MLWSLLLLEDTGDRNKDTLAVDDDVDGWCRVVAVDIDAGIADIDAGAHAEQSIPKLRAREGCGKTRGGDGHVRKCRRADGDSKSNDCEVLDHLITASFWQNTWLTDGTTFCT